MINKSKIVKDAQKFVAKGQLDKAIDEYIKITKAFPNDSNTHNTIGDLYLKVGNKKKAIEAFKSAADILNRDGFALKAIALYKKVLNINPEQIEVQMLMGKLNAERGMIGNANENYLVAASYFTKNNKKDRALEVYKILCSLNPKNMTLAQKLAELYMSEGLEKEGISKLIELAEVRADDGDLKNAKMFLEKASHKGRDRHDFNRVLAMVNLKDGRMPEAVSQLESLRDQDPNDEKVLSLLSEAYLHSGRYEDAASAISTLVDNEPENFELRRKLIDIHIKSGDFNAAWEHYRYQVEAYIENKGFNKAQKLVTEFLEHSPDSIEPRQVLIDLFSNIGRDDRIKELSEEIADIYTRTGDTEKALEVYNKLLEMDPDNENYKTSVMNLGQMDTSSVKKAPPPEPEAPDLGVSVEEPGDDTPSMPGIEDMDVSPGDEAEAPGEGLDGYTLEEPAPGDDTPSIPGVEEMYVSPGDKAEAQEPGEGFGSNTLEEPAPGEGPDEFGFEPKTEEGLSEGGGVYDLSDAGGDELPPLDLGGDTDEDIFSGRDTQENVYDLSADTATDIGDIDIFGSDDGNLSEDTGDDEIKIVSETPSLDLSDLETGDDAEAGTGFGAESEAAAGVEEPAFQGGSTFEESLTEADVYLKYGLYPKAHEILSSLESTRPGDPEIQSRLIEICRSQGDTDGFIDKTIKLAVFYRSKDREDDAREILNDALTMHPNDERLRMCIEDSGAAVREDVASGEGHAELTEESGLPEDISGGAYSLQDEETEVSTTGSVNYIEELAEADFYANQGLYDEAMGIYRRLLAADPENDELRAKYNKLLDMEQESRPEPELEVVTDKPMDEPSVEPEELEMAEAVAEPAASDIDNELDEAFTEMDFEDEAIEEPVIEQAVEKPVIEEASEEPELAVEEEPMVVGDDDFFDLAAELHDEIAQEPETTKAQSGPIKDNNLDEVFQEFRRGVSEQIGDEDYETHYNLGIAYKEMGMIDEALSEFIEASKDPSRTLDCASMIGLCHLEKGEYNKAIEQFKKGLALKGRQKEEYFGLNYDMATAYELSGDPASALDAISEIYKLDKEFRDVEKRYQRLLKAHGPASGDEAPERDTKTKKSRVSYL